MKKQKIGGMKIIQHILGILVISAFLFFIWGEVSLPAENVSEENSGYIFRADWVQVMEDGTEVPVSVHKSADAEKGEWVTIATTLPQDQEDTWICARSMQQDMRIYVGDELRKEYSTLDTQLFGKTSTMTYVFFPIYSGDAGETLRIEFMTDSSYAGYVSEIYEGSRSDIERYFYDLYAPSIIVAILMFLIGLLVVGCCIFVRLCYKRSVDLLYLGGGILMAATWLIVESKLRQFVFPNSTVAMWMGFLMVAVLPCPFMAYINTVQKARYQKAYMVVSACAAINYVVVVALQVMNIKDFFETMTSSHIILLVAIVLMGGTIVVDMWRGYMKEYREVAIGFAVFMLTGVFEIALSYMVDAQLNGIALCVGLVVLLIAAGLKSLRDLFKVEKEKQFAIAASESKAKFLANMSHEIRTPINTIIGMNEMILRENKDETIEEYAYDIKSASRMLLGLINDVLDFSKIEAGKLQIIEEDYQLASMLKDVILGIGVRVKEKNLELKLDIDETMPSVLKGDEIRIKQILNNLLSNAIKYTEKGSITLSAKGVRDENGFSLALSVADTGMGVKKEDMEKLFASFQRLELSKNRYIEGTGLGLNIVQQLVNGMNGAIDVQSEYGVGSCFSVQIPQQIVDNTAMGKLNRKPKRSSEEMDLTKNTLSAPDATLLVVDDTQMNLRVIRELLKRSGLKLDFATSGNECFEKTKKKKYDLILMDHMMPEPDGVQTLHMIRDDNDNLNRETNVIVLTANAIAGMREQYLKEGFADYLSKPVEAKKLEETIAKFLNLATDRSGAYES